MQNLVANPSLRINEQAFSLTEVFGQMMLFGKLQPFLQEFASQHVIVQAINNRDDLDVDSAELMQAIMEFRLKRELTEQDKFNAWLAKEHLNNSTFQQRVMLELKVQKLQERIAEPDLSSYFEEHQDALEQLKLSSVLVSDESVAHELKDRVAVSDDLQQLVSASANAEVTVRVFKQQAQRRSLPVDVKEQFESASPGDVVGPANLNGTWCLFRVEEIMPAELDEQTQKQLAAQLFSKWLVEQLKTVEISFDANMDPESES